MSEMVKQVMKAIMPLTYSPVDPEEIARAAIEAMREPTDLMIDRTLIQGESPVVTAGGPQAQLAHKWRLMIDEALKG